MFQNNLRDSKDQWAVLAVLRFVLAACVFGGHVAYYVHPYPYPILFGLLNPGSAVFGFFLLSGFSIAASIEKGSAGFYRRRVIRIWPLYLVTIAFGIFVSEIIGDGFKLPLGQQFPVPSALNIVVSLLMLQNIVAPPILVIGQIWSLAPEWWHYVATPLFKRMSSLLLGVWILVSFYAMLRIKPPGGHGAEALGNGVGLIYLSWFWVSGFLYHRFRGTPVGFAIVAAPPVAAVILGHDMGLPMFMSVFVLVLSTEFAVPPSLSRLFILLGDVSYPLYLLHLPVIVLALALGYSSVISFTAPLMISVLSVYLVDYPSRKLLKRWFFTSGARRKLAAETIDEEKNLVNGAGVMESDALRSQ